MFPFTTARGVVPPRTKTVGGNFCSGSTETGADDLLLVLEELEARL